MAFYETRTLQVANNPSVIDKATNEAALFMWQVQSQQITDRKDTHTEHSSDAYYIYETVVTESANYCTITLQRDRTIPRYNEIVDLEKQLANIRYLNNERYISSVGEFSILKLLIGISVLPLGILFLIQRKNRINKDKPKEEAFYEEKRRRLASLPTEEDIINKAFALSQQIMIESGTK